MLPCEFVSIISITAIDYKFIPAQPPAGHRLLSHTAVSVYLAYVWHSGAVQQCNNATQKIEGYGILRVFTYVHVNIKTFFSRVPLNKCYNRVFLLHVAPPLEKHNSCQGANLHRVFKKASPLTKSFVFSYNFLMERNIKTLK